MVERQKLALEHLKEHNSITRSGNACIELPCIVSSYPHRDDYADNTITDQDLKDHIKQGAGINIELVDFPCSSTLLLEWSEINCFQLFTEYYRGDPRPQLNLSAAKSHDHLYCDELANKLDTVQGDVLQTLELALAFEKCKTKNRQRKLNSAKIKAASTQ